jgi:hypothetical protein
MKPVASGASAGSLLAQRDWLIEGFTRAYDRLKAEVSKGDSADPMEMFIPLFEALHWSAALADRIPGTKFKTGREHDVRDGIKFARNRVGHHWARAIELRDVPFAPGLVTIAGRSGGSRIVAPPVVKAWCWCASARLPVPKDPKHRNPGLQRRYVSELEGKPVLEALDVMATALARIRQTP